MEKEKQKYIKDTQKNMIKKLSSTDMGGLADRQDSKISTKSKIGSQTNQTKAPNDRKRESVSRPKDSFPVSFEKCDEHGRDLEALCIDCKRYLF